MKYFGDSAALWQLVLVLLDGMKTSLAVFFLTLALSLPIGLLVALGRRSTKGIIWRPVAAYILVMRGTPLILQILTIYFILPQVLPIRIDRFWAAILSFTLNYAAYLSEIFRGGIDAIPRGQYEAGQVLGFTKPQIFLRIVLPQVIKHILPAMSNEVITLVKDTALVTTVGIGELYRAAKNESSRTFSTEPLLVAGLMYLGLNSIVTRAFSFFEKKLSYYR